MTTLPSAKSRGKSIPKDLRIFLKRFLVQSTKAELGAYLVGGYVRDLMLGKPSLDIDIVVEGDATALAKALAKVYKAKLVSHPEFLTHTLVFKNGRHLDLAAARMESYPEPAILPVVKGASLQEDLYRRDFSINAMAFGLRADANVDLWDPFGGLEDLRERKIRALHAESFRDDPTRIFRAARFAGRLGYDLDWRTREWLLDAIRLQYPQKLSGARLREELLPILAEKDPRPAFRLLEHWKALESLMPGLKWEKSHDILFAGILHHVKKKADPMMLRLLALVHALPVSKAVGAMSHMMFPQKQIEQIEQALTLLEHLRNGTLTLDHSRGFRALSPEIRAFLDEAVHHRTVLGRKQSADEWHKLQFSTPCLSGQDILDLGYKSGPLFTKIFEALRLARWEGKLRTREEEIRFILRTFPLAAIG